MSQRKTHRWPFSPGISLALAAAVAAALAVAAWIPGRVAAGSSGPASAVLTAATRTPAAALITNHVRVCGQRSVLGGGPATLPKGAIRVKAGNNSGVNWRRANRTYWFAPGVHTLGSGTYSQVQPGSHSTYIGAPGAVLNGQHKNDYAFASNATDVTISYLTIENFGQKGGNFDQGVVNVDLAAGWTVDHSTITDNGGAGVMLASHNTLTDDCLADNGQYGFSAYTPRGPSHIVMENNEIAGNDTYNWEAHQAGCGCTGGGKFWDVNGAIIKNNWVHNNHSVGIWADTDNRGFDIEGNAFENNYSEGLIYEISYNALIKDNLFLRNALGDGPKNTGFPTPALYVSESGSDSRVHTSYRSSFTITGNMFVNNWSAVVLWENANRYCGSPYVGSTGYCTLIDPKVANLRTCDQAHLQGSHASQKPDYFDLCRWKVQNVTVSDNTFDFSPAAIGSSCTAAKGCGFVGLFSEFGSDPSWSPYHGTIVENNITFHQDNHFTDNTYNGPWRYMVWSNGKTASWSYWRSHFHQDAGSARHPAAS
jgi:hypothetical protein